MIGPGRFALAAGAALVAGAVNAIAGGGSLITFPALVAGGLSSVTASVTNTIAMCPGYLGATLAQRRDLAGQGRRMLLLLPAGVAGGIAGGVLLLHTGEAAFARIVPYLILFAALLLAIQDPLRRWLLSRGGGTHDATGDRLPASEPRDATRGGVNSPAPPGKTGRERPLWINARTRDATRGGVNSPAPPGKRGRERPLPIEAWAIVPIGLAAIYGGYFGAGMGVMLLAALAVVVGDSLTRLNALKQSVSLAVNVAAAVLFVFSDRVDWPIAGVMLVASLTGGAVGGMIASRIPPAVLRWTVVTLAVIVAAVYLVR